MSILLYRRRRCPVTRRRDLNGRFVHLSQAVPSGIADPLRGWVEALPETKGAAGTAAAIGEDGAALMSYVANWRE